jgi:hypothetical protein
MKDRAESEEAPDLVGNTPMVRWQDHRGSQARLTMGGEGEDCGAGV